MTLLNSGAKAVLFPQLALSNLNLPSAPNRSVDRPACVAVAMSGQPGERLLRRRSRTAEHGDEGGSSYTPFTRGSENPWAR